MGPINNAMGYGQQAMTQPQPPMQGDPNAAQGMMSGQMGQLMQQLLGSSQGQSMLAQMLMGAGRAYGG